MEKVEQNTENFYKEINGDCNIEKLKNIANEKIFLYETLLSIIKFSYIKVININLLSLMVKLNKKNIYKLISNKKYSKN